MKILLILSILKLCMGHDRLLTKNLCDGEVTKDFTIDLITQSDGGNWNCKMANIDCGNVIPRPKLVNKNDTFAQFTPSEVGFPNVFELSYSVGDMTKSKKVVRTVDNNEEEIPIHRLATKIVRQLMSDSYEYLYLKHNFLRFDNYLPNVANFFKAKQEFVQDIRDEIITYVLQKHATTSMKPKAHIDYSCSLFSKNGLKHPVIIRMESLGEKNIKESLDFAFKNEANLLSELTEIVKIADEYEDSELAEYVGHDLVFKIQESMKSLQDHRNTVDGLTKDYQGLGEYLFDKHQF